MKNKKILLAAVALSGLMVNNVHAAVTCSIETGAATVFGVYDSLSSTHHDATGEIRVKCATDALVIVGYTISLGTGTAASYTPRRMSAGGSLLDYNIYTASDRATIWGDGTNGTSKVSGEIAIIGGSGSATHPTYGRIFGGQHTAAAGSYTDSLAITVSF